MISQGASACPEEDKLDQVAGGWENPFSLFLLHTSLHRRVRSSYPNVKHRFPVTSETVASCVACLQTRSYTHLPQITSKLPGCRGCCCRFPCNIQEINHSRESKRVIKLIAWPTLSILIVCAGSPRSKATERPRVLNMQEAFQCTA